MKYKVEVSPTGRELRLEVEAASETEARHIALRLANEEYKNDLRWRTSLVFIEETRWIPTNEADYRPDGNTD